MLRPAFAIAALLALGMGTVADAQEQPADTASQGPPAPATAEEVAAAAKQALEVRRQREACRKAQGNEIVVCAQELQDQRVESDTDPGINTDDGKPRAPDLFGIPAGGVVVARGCFIPPCPRPMPIMIDLKAIPEAPPGSDAAAYGEE